MFPLVMALGGVLGIAGVPLPFVEVGIAASAITLGLLVRWPSGRVAVRTLGGLISAGGCLFLLRLI